jgi:hypothetical protein
VKINLEKLFGPPVPESEVVPKTGYCKQCGWGASDPFHDPAPCIHGAHYIWDEEGEKHVALNVPHHAFKDGGEHSRVVHD